MVGMDDDDQIPEGTLRALRKLLADRARPDWHELAALYLEVRMAPRSQQIKPPALTTPEARDARSLQPAKRMGEALPKGRVERP
jgi:hypothetical protein